MQDLSPFKLLWCMSVEECMCALILTCEVKCDRLSGLFTYTCIFMTLVTLILLFALFIITSSDSWMAAHSTLSKLLYHSVLILFSVELFFCFSILEVITFKVLCKLNSYK